MGTPNRGRGASLHHGFVAIVLSCDRYHPLAEHMVGRYDTLWTGHPLTFRVPYQSEPTSGASARLAAKPHVHMVPTPPDIKSTVLSLIADLSDADWIYWCIDDKYVVELDEAVMAQAAEWVPMLPTAVVGLSLCRCRKLLSNSYLREAGSIMAPWGERMLGRSTLHQFWLHSFLRVGFLRDLFKAFPDRAFTAKEMDVFTGQVDDVPDVPIPDDLVYLVSEHNHMVLGESTSAGMLTQNLVESLAESGSEPPVGFEISERTITMGGPPTTGRPPDDSLRR